MKSVLRRFASVAALSLLFCAFFTGCAGSAAPPSSGSTTPTNNPVPGLTSLSPSVVATGTAVPTTVTVTGTDFISSSVVQVGGSARTTAYVSSTQLTFQLTVADEAVAGKLSVTVANPAPGGGTSPAATLTVAAPTPTAIISQVSPTSFLAGSASSYLAVLGTNLLSTSTVLWNGTPLTTSYLYSSYVGYYLSAVVPASLLTTMGTASITVSTPTANPQVSNALPVSITNPPAPTLTSLSPSSGPINTASTLTLYGTGFTAASTVAYNGTSVPATYVNSTTLTVTLSAASVPLPGVGSFTVTTPAPGGGTTAGLNYTAYIGIANNSMVYNPVSGLFYVSVPSSAGAPYGNSVVSVDPETGALGTPIPVGSEPNKLAITADGKYLWVGLDGAGAIRKVDLSAGKAGLQFSLGGNSGVYASPATALALVALPGATDSVIVSSTSSYSNLSLAIYDSGVLRGTAVGNYSYNAAYAVQVDGTKNEIYAGGSTYSTYTYSAAGLTLKATSTTTATYASYSADEMQVAGGRLYTDIGKVFDPESGSLLGTVYSGGSTAAVGPTVADTTLGKIFVLDNPSTSYNFGSYSQIQVFNVADYNPSSSAVIAISVPYSSSTTTNSYASRLTRWGTNGLAFRTFAGVYSVRSNLVKDLSSTVADLAVSVTANGGSAPGGNTTFTATVVNNGPSTATNIALTASLPATGLLISVTPSAGACGTANGATCNLGSLASGATATVSYVVLQTTAGSSTLSVTVSGSETDSNSANNQASVTATVAGAAYNLPPQITSISPVAILSGSSDTVVTVKGSGFASGSSVLLGGVALVTSFTNSSTLTAVVPATKLTTLGWSALSVSTPAPGGGTSSSLPLSVYSVITLGLNHVVYDPYTRKIMGSVGSGSSTVAGNSIVAISPDTATVGTPVPIGSQPTFMALTSDGQILYTILSGSQSVARFNMLTQAADFTYAVPTPASAAGGVALRGIATQPGTENTVALDLASFSGNAIYDFNPATRTAAIRGQASGPYSGSCIQFLDAANMLAFDTDTSGGTLDHYTVTAAGFTYYNYSQYSESTLLRIGCFKINGGLVYGGAGGVANAATTPATQLGVFGLTNNSYSYGVASVAPDTSLQRAFFGVDTSGATYSSTFNGLQAFDTTTYLATATIPLAVATIEGNTSAAVTDLIRWGQDGLAILSSGGHLYLLRGAAVAPQLLNTNTAAVLTASSSTSITHGAGNTLLALTGSNFIPGVAVTWNGSYRTTTIVDATHVTVAIPASDLAAAGSGSLVATNPGAPASGALTVAVP